LKSLRIPRRALATLGFVALLVFVLGVTAKLCVSAGRTKGAWLDQCPSGEVKAIVRVDAPSILRGQRSEVTLTVHALYTVDPADDRREEPVRPSSAALVLSGP
jgi:hypothetical protein